MTGLEAAEWSGAALSMAGAYLTARREGLSKFVGFWIFAVANVVLALWALTAGTYGILVMQTYFMFTTYTGLRSHWAGQT